MMRWFGRLGRRWLGLLGCLLLVRQLHAGDAPAAESRQLLDHIVAVVDRDVITAQQMRQEMQLALIWRSGVAALQAFNSAQAATPPLPEANERPLTTKQRAMADLAASLQDYIVDQYLLALEARRQGSNDVDERSVQARLQQLHERFANAAAFAAFCAQLALDQEQLLNILRRDLVNERFIAARLQLRRGLAAARYTAGAESPPHSEWQAFLAEWLLELKQHIEIRRLGKGGLLEVQPRPRL